SQTNRLRAMCVRLLLKRSLRVILRGRGTRGNEAARRTGDDSFGEVRRIAAGRVRAGADADLSDGGTWRLLDLRPGDLHNRGGRRAIRWRRIGRDSGDRGVIVPGQI